MRNDAHLHAERPSQTRSPAVEFLWVLSFAALMAFLFLALAGWIR